MAKANDEMNILGDADDTANSVDQAAQPVGADDVEAQEPTVAVKQSDLSSIQSALTQASAALSQYVPQGEEEAGAEMPEVEAGETGEEPMDMGGGNRMPRKL